MRSPSSSELAVFDSFTTRIDGVFLPSINRNSVLQNFNIPELRPPTEIIDSESEGSQIRSSKNDYNIKHIKLYDE